MPLTLFMRLDIKWGNNSINISFFMHLRNNKSDKVSCTTLALKKFLL